MKTIKPNTPNIGIATRLTVDKDLYLNIISQQFRAVNL
jgi:hypothetical protein